MKLFILQYPSHQVNVCTSPSCLETSYCYSVSARGGLTPHAAKPMVGSASCGITCHGRSLAVIKPSKGQAMEGKADTLEQQMQGARSQGTNMLGKGLCVKALGLKTWPGSRLMVGR
jgi:hypothetical protein